MMTTHGEQTLLSGTDGSLMMNMSHQMKKTTLRMSERMEKPFMIMAVMCFGKPQDLLIGIFKSACRSVAIMQALCQKNSIGFTQELHAM